jgi:hypothetical protein
MLWAYVSFSQYLVIWFGDLSREIPWYLHRTRGGWDKVAIGLIVLHFAVPFVLLLSRRLKRSRRVLPVLAGALVVVHSLDVFWRVRPPLDPAGLSIHVSDLLAPLVVGAFWVGAFLFHLRRSPMQAAHA